MRVEKSTVSQVKERLAAMVRCVAHVLAKLM